MDKILVFLADGFEEVEALTVIDYLRRAGIGVDTVTINDSLDVRAAHDVIIKADKLLGDINEDEYRGLYVPGGTKGAENLRDDERVIEIVKSFYDDGKTVAAICAGPIVLDKAGVLADKKCVSFPSIKAEINHCGAYLDDELVVVDKNVITSRGAGATLYLALKLVEILEGEEAKEQLKPTIQQDFVEKYFGFKY